MINRTYQDPARAQPLRASSDVDATPDAGRESKDARGGGDYGFVRFLVHELRNMVAPIRNAAHVLRLRGGADPDLRTMAEIIERQVTGIGRLLNLLAEAERIKRGEVTLALAPTDLRAVIDSAVQAVLPAIESRQHRLLVNVPAAPISLRADAARLEQVLTSVLENAARYTAEGGEIRLDALCVGSDAQVRVRDNGSGIAAEFLPGLFDFFNVEKPGQTGQSGLGVSLAIARRLIELHGGSITVASAGPARGSEFLISLPLDSTESDVPESVGAEPSEVPMEARATEGQTQRRIVIADDNAAIRVSLCALLTDLGHTVKAAADGEEALELAQAWLPDYVFLDISMPKLNGFEVARQLRTRFPANAMRLVMMSGASLDEATLRGAKRAGFDHCIDKIADPGLLAEVLAQGPPSF